MSEGSDVTARFAAKPIFHRTFNQVGQAKATRIGSHDQRHKALTMLFKRL
jgi:hypothetical protein